MKSLSSWLVLVFLIYIPRTECTKKKNGISSHNIWKGGKHTDGKKSHDKAADKRGIVPEYLQGNDYVEGGVPASYPSRDLRGTGLDVQSPPVATAMDEEDFTKDLRYDNGDLPADIYATGMTPSGLGQQERFNLSTLDKIDELSTKNLFDKFMQESVPELPPKTNVLMNPKVPPVNPFHRHRQHNMAWKQRKVAINPPQRLLPTNGVKTQRFTHKKYHAKVEKNNNEDMQHTINEQSTYNLPTYHAPLQQKNVDSEDLSPTNGSCFYDYDPSHKMTKMCVIQVDSISTPNNNQKSIENSNINQNSIENDNINHKSIEIDNINHKSFENDNINHKSTENDNINHKSIENDNINHKSILNDSINHKSIENVSINHKSIENDSINHKSIENDKPNHASIEGTIQPSNDTFIKKMNVTNNILNKTSIENKTQMANESSSDKFADKSISLKKAGKENVYAINISHSTPDGNDFMTISYHFNRDKQQSNFSNISINSNLGNILSDAIMNSLAEKLSNTNGYSGGNDSFDSLHINNTTLNDVLSSFGKKENMSQNANNTINEGILYLPKKNSSEGRNISSQNGKVNDEINETFIADDSLSSKGKNRTKMFNKLWSENGTLLGPNATHSAGNSTNLDTFLNILSLNEALSKLINKEKHNPQAFRPESMELMRSILTSMNGFYSDFKSRAFGNKTNEEAQHARSPRLEGSLPPLNQTNKNTKTDVTANSLINATPSLKNIPVDLTKAGIERLQRENITDLPILNDEFLQLHDDFLKEDDWHAVEDGYADASKKNTLFPKSSTENTSRPFSESNESNENSSKYSLSDLERNNMEVLANMSRTLKDNPMGKVIQKSLLRRQSNVNESSDSNVSRDVTPSNDEVKNNDENAVGEDEFLDKLFSSDTKDNNTANIDTLVATMHDSLFKLYAKVKNNTVA